MSDCISRQAAIDALERKKDKNAKGDVGGFYNKIIQNDIDALMQLPSAQPERKRGKWIIHPKGIYAHLVCNKCLSNAPYDCKANFCPNCGCEMREDDHETD